MFRNLALVAAVVLPADPPALADGPAFVVVRSIRPAIGEDDGPVVVNYGIKYDDLDRLLANVPAIDHAVPIRELETVARHERKEHGARVVGTAPGYLELAGLEIDRGRDLSDDDHQRYANVAVIGPAVAEALFPDADPIGASIKLGGDYYEVVGVARRTGDATGADALLGREVGDDVIIPLNTCRVRFGERVLVDRGGRRHAEETQITRLILEVHGDPHAARDAIETSVKPYHPGGDVEVRVVTPLRQGR